MRPHDRSATNMPRTGIGVISRQASSELAAEISTKTDSTPSTAPTIAPVWIARYWTTSSPPASEYESKVAVLIGDATLEEGGGRRQQLDKSQWSTRVLIHCT